ncbi:MAG: transporter [Hyphomonas sp.]|nr:transporter [Hyphomonas sp.]
MRPPRLAVSCAWAGLMAATMGPAWAEPAPPFAQLVEQIEQAPASREAAALEDAASARVLQARARPNPIIGIETENVLGSGLYSGFSNAETTLSVSQDLELWNRRGVRIGAARAEADAAAVRRDLAVTDAVGRLATVYAEAEAAQRRFQLAEEALELTLADTNASLAQVEEGRQPRLRAVQAEAEAASARATLDEARADMDAAFVSLTVMAMLSSPVTAVADSLLDRTEVLTAPSNEQAPAIKAAEAERLAAERRIRVERSLGRPDVTANVGVRRSQMDDATSFTLGFSLPLPFFDQNRGNIQAAQAELRATEARLEAARQDVRAQQGAAVARLKASASRVSAADAGVASAEEAYQLSRIGFESGRISQLELLTSRSALISARTAAVDARLARAGAEIDLARLEGRTPFEGDQK